MSEDLKAKVRELYEAVKDAKSFEEIDPLCEQFNKWVDQKGWSLSTKASRLSDAGLNKLFSQVELIQGKNAESTPKYADEARTQVKGYVLKHRALILCNLSSEEWAQRNQTSRVGDRLSHGEEIDPDKYLNVIENLLQSNDYRELAVGIIAATGRRPTEILVRGKFSALAGEEYKVKFSGQLKKRGQGKPYEIPVLFPAQFIIKKFQLLRRDPAIKELIADIEREFPKDIEAQNRAVNSRRKESINRVVRRFFGEGDTPVLPIRHGKENDSASSLRAAYAMLATERDCPGGFGAKLQFAGQILGHLDGDAEDDRELRNIITSLGYADYFTTKPIPYRPAPSTEKTIAVRCYVSDHELFESIQKELGASNQMEAMRLLIDSFKTREAAARELTEARQQLEQAHQKFEQERETMISLDDIEALIDRKIAAALACSPKTPTEAIIEETPQEKIKVEIIANTPEKPSGRQQKSQDKITQAYLATTTYNSTIAPSNTDRVAVTNQVLRALTGCNPSDVGEWIASHKDEVISHNQSWELHNQKDPGNVTTFANKGKNLEAILSQIKKLIVNE